MALFVDHLGREREPLGGREADGFDWWLMNATQSAREAVGVARRRDPVGSAVRYVATEAERGYEAALARWQVVKRSQRQHVKDDLARDQFEVQLIARVMSAYGALEYARGLGCDPDDWTSGGRPMMDVEAEYNRACLILGAYTGLDDATVKGCRDDQGALMALGSTQD